MSDEKEITQESDKLHAASDKPALQSAVDSQQSGATNQQVTGNPTPGTSSQSQPLLQPEVQPQPMEVHKHPHHVMHKKKWGEYFLEFAMLFLAVFLGFLAENWREHIVESNREKEYIKSFYEDLTADERDLQSNINFLRAQAQEADSLHALMRNITKKQPANIIYMYLRGVTRGTAGLLYPNDKTIVQLRNAGGMRLIKNKRVSDSMALYYREIELIKVLNNEIINTKTSLREKSIPLLNANDYRKIVDSTSTIIEPGETIYLRSADPEIINSCLVEVNRIETVNRGLAVRIRRLKERASRIKEFIRKEYHLKDE